MGHHAKIKAYRRAFRLAVRANKSVAEAAKLIPDTLTVRQGRRIIGLPSPVHAGQKYPHGLSREDSRYAKMRALPPEPRVL